MLKKTLWKLPLLALVLMLPLFAWAYDPPGAVIDIGLDIEVPEQLHIDDTDLTANDASEVTLLYAARYRSVVYVPLELTEAEIRVLDLDAYKLPEVGWRGI